MKSIRYLLLGIAVFLPVLAHANPTDPGMNPTDCGDALTLTLTSGNQLQALDANGNPTQITSDVCLANRTNLFGGTGTPFTTLNVTTALNPGTSFFNVDGTVNYTCGANPFFGNCLVIPVMDANNQVIGVTYSFSTDATTSGIPVETPCEVTNQCSGDFELVTQGYTPAVVALKLSANVSPSPEPSALLMVGSTLCGTVILFRRRKALWKI